MSQNQKKKTPHGKTQKLNRKTKNIRKGSTKKVSFDMKKNRVEKIYCAGYQPPEPKMKSSLPGTLIFEEFPEIEM